MKYRAGRRSVPLASSEQLRPRFAIALGSVGDPPNVAFILALSSAALSFLPGHLEPRLHRDRDDHSRRTLGRGKRGIADVGVSQHPCCLQHVETDHGCPAGDRANRASSSESTGSQSGHCYLIHGRRHHGRTFGSDLSVTKAAGPHPK